MVIGLAGSCDGCRSSTPSVRSGMTDDEPKRPLNVVLIVVDTLRADHLGVYGHHEDTSPNIDALAQRGTHLTRVTSAASTTLASVTSLLTSKYTLRHGVYRNGVKWPKDLVGLQQRLADAGYRTAGFVASHALHSRHGVARGFDSWDQPKQRRRRGARVTRSVLRWLDEHETKQQTPFFALVHYFDPHAPYVPPGHHDLFGGDYERKGQWTGKRPQIRRVRKLLRRRADGARKEAERLHSFYEGEIHYMDAQVGRLLDGIAERGLQERTLVVLTADHGETMLEHRLFWKWDSSHFNHGFTAYQTEVHVPLIFAGPGIPAGQSVHLPVSNIDIAPTLLEMLGEKVADGIQGRSFARWLVGDPPDPWDRVQFAEGTKPHRKTDAWPNRHAARCVVNGRWKVVHWPWRNDRWELYDLRTDPLEQNDIWDAGVAPDGMRDRLAKLLKRWSNQREDDATGSKVQSEKLKESLRALGYAQ